MGRTRRSSVTKSKSAIAVEKKRAYDPARNKVKHLKQRYNLSEEQYNSMCLAQGCKCAVAVCRKIDAVKKSGKMISLSVDHNHITNKIRGLLCRRCNSILGLANDNIDLLLSLVKYLKATNN